MKPGHTEDMPESHEGATAWPGADPRCTKHNQPTQRRQDFITLSKRTPTKWIEDDIHATATGESMYDRGNIVMVIINRMLHALLIQKGVLGRRRRAVHFRLPEAGQLYRRQTNPTGSAMDEHMLTRLQPTTDIQHEVGGQIVHRQCGSSGERHVRWQGKHLLRGYHDALGIPPKACQRQHGLPGLQVCHALPHYFHAADLEPGQAVLALTRFGGYAERVVV